ncbi:MAG: hypothetical protein AAF721_20080 [Myxococcota bacterium]
MSALAMWGCDPGDDDNGTTSPATTIAGTAGDDGGGTTMAEDTAGDDEDTAAPDDDEETGDPNVCDPACPDGEECVSGTCFPAMDDMMDADTMGMDDNPTGGGGNDANYPNPGGGCPAGTADGNMAVMMNICIPMCDGTAANIQAACPQPATGTAVGLCILGDGSGSMEACDMNGLACEGANEFCLGDPMTMMNGCSNATGCMVSCQQGLVCPDGMTCNAQMFCEYM